MYTATIQRTSPGCTKFVTVGTFGPEWFGTIGGSPRRRLVVPRLDDTRGRASLKLQTQPLHELVDVVIRFAGDSGDGMQLTGERFSVSSALFGNDLATVPDYPAEIRAPAGTMGGVSAFQIHISDHDILTPGDRPNVLVAMNPAALRANVGDLAPGSTLIVNLDAFEDRNLAKAGYASNPLSDGSLGRFTVYEVPMTSLTIEAARPSGAKSRDAERSKNFFALGLVSWMYSRPSDLTLAGIEERFGANPAVAAANQMALEAGYNVGRDGGVGGRPVQGEAHRVRARHLHQYQREHGAGVGTVGGRAAGQAARVPGLVPDHAGLGHPPRAVQAPELRGPDPAGRGRDRARGFRRPRRCLRGPARRHDH